LETKIATKLKQEINSFMSLTLINIVFSAVAMAFGISALVPNVTSMMAAKSVLFPQLFLVIIGFLAFIVSIKWLVTSAEMFETATELKEDYAKNKAFDEEARTGLVVKMISYYRENKPTIKKMMFISRIAGVCFLISGAFTLTTVAINVARGVQSADLLAQVSGAAVAFAIAVASFIIPYFFGEYSKIWDHRLQKTVKVEKELKKQLGED
jgi:energy-coupling factor transporter transmembrane protein EcfT